MLKKCIVLNDKVINVGEWDYKIKVVEISPAEYDKDGKVIKEAVSDEMVTNPLPEGAMIEERDFDFNNDTGWHEIGAVTQPTSEERLKALEDTMLMIL